MGVFCGVVGSTVEGKRVGHLYGAGVKRGGVARPLWGDTRTFRIGQAALSPAASFATSPHDGSGPWQTRGWVGAGDSGMAGSGGRAACLCGQDGPDAP